MNDDIGLADIVAADSHIGDERQTSFREEIERLFADYTARLRTVLGFLEVTEQREQEEKRSEGSRRKTPKR